MVANLAASSHATVTENARIKIHRDTWRRTVFRASRAVRRKTRARQVLAPGESLKLTIPGMLLASARARMVRHQKLKKCSTGTGHLLGIRTHDHARFRWANARRGENPRSHIYDAHTAHAYRGFILLVAQGWDCNAIQAGCVKHSCTRGDRNFVSVDRKFDECGAAHAGLEAIAAIFGRLSAVKQMPDGHSRRDKCASTSSRKCFSTDEIGAGTTCPRPQIEVSRRASESSSIRLISFEDPSPMVHPVSRSTIFCEPTLHGTHLPQDSLRKNRVAFSAMSNMHVPSAQTTSAPEPSMEPASASDLKSNRTSAMDAGRYPDEGPDGAKPFSFFPLERPPAY